MYGTLEQYKDALDATAMVEISNYDGIITYVNDKFCAQTQYSRHDLIGTHNSIINANYHSSQFWQDMWETIRASKQWRGEIRSKAKDGSYFWLDTTIIPLCNTADKQQYVAISQEITQAKRVQEILVIASAQTQTVGFFYDHKTGRVQLTPNSASILGTTQDITSISFEDFFQRLAHPEDIDATAKQIFSDHLDPCISEHSFRYRIIRPDNQQIQWVQAGGKIARDGEGKVLSTTGYIKDINAEVLSIQAAQHLQTIQEVQQAQLTKEHQEQTIAYDAQTISYNILEIASTYCKTLGFHYDHRTSNIMLTKNAPSILGTAKGISNMSFTQFFASMVHPDDATDTANKILANFADKNIHQGICDYV